MNASLGKMYVSVKNNNNMRIFKYVQGEPSIMYVVFLRMHKKTPGELCMDIDLAFSQVVHSGWYGHKN